MKERVLVVGGTGFIGKHVLKKIPSKKYKLYSISKKNLKHKKRIKGVNYLKCDISNSKELNKKISKKFDHIINLSGYVDHSNRKENMNCHFNGCKNLVKFFNNTEIKTFIQVGSSLEYGNKTSPQSENERCNPRGSYGLSKYKASNFLKNFGKLYDFPYIIIRPYQIYGPNQKKNRLIPQTIEACLKNKKFDCTDGLQKRDFLFIDDFVDLIKKIIKNKKIRKEIFNVGYGKPIKVRNIIEKITKMIKKGKPMYGSIKMRKDEILKLYPNTRKVKKFFNWTPKISINIGLKKTIRHYNEIL